MKKFYQYMFLCIINLIPIALPSYARTVSLPYVYLNDSINKSERDDREYQLIELFNGMKVLLISDPKAVKSSAALALPIGSLYDPKLQQGLAHFTEHMVLMGSKKYPNPADFAEYLSSNSGTYNASTSLTRTSFYFEVEHSALAGALDRLADAIANPLFDAKYVDKERNAVNAEMTMARTNDGFRIEQINAETISQNHPASMFSGGNLETLADKPNSKLHDELIEFHRNYYTANKMVAVLYSNQPISKLDTLAASTLRRIGRDGGKITKISQPALTQANLGKIIYMEPAQAKKLLYVQFPLEKNMDQFAFKIDEYIGYMISNRSPNTLFDQLQKQGLIESINAGGEPLRFGTSGVFSIYARLTDQGLLEKDRVLASIFSYLKLLQQTGVDEKYYHELQKVLALEFKYPDITRDMDYVEYLADQMLLYPAKHILDANYVADNYNPKAIKERLNSFTLDHARIWVIAPDQKTDKKAYFVDAPYRIEDLTAAQKNSLMTQAKQFQFSLPLLNPYIPDKFIIEQNDKSVESQNNQPFDVKGNYLHFASRYFTDEPKAVVALSLRNNYALENVKNQVMLFLLDYLANRQLATLRFQAEVAGISISTQVDSGIMIMANGFNQHLLDMVNASLTTYRKFEINDEALSLAKSWYLEKLDAAEHVNSYSLAFQPVNAITHIPYFDRVSKREIISTINAADLRRFRDQLLTDAVPYMLTLGNLSEKQSLQLYHAVKNHLNSAIDYHPSETIKVNDKLDALINQQTISSDNALFMGFVPKGYDKITSQNISYLLSKIISPWFYNQLRSNEQLGYAVFSMPISISDSSGIGFLIQSNQYDPAYLNQRYQAFYPIILDKLNGLTDEEFTNYKQSVVNELLMSAQTLDEEFTDYLVDFANSQFSFDSKQKRVAQLKLLAKDDVIKFFTQAVIAHEGLMFASEVIGNQPDKNLHRVEGLTPYTNATELQKVLLGL